MQQLKLTLSISGSYGVIRLYQIRLPDIQRYFQQILLPDRKIMTDEILLRQLPNFIATGYNAETKLIDRISPSVDIASAWTDTHVSAEEHP